MEKEDRFILEADSVKALIQKKIFEPYVLQEDVEGYSLLEIVRKSEFPPEIFRYLRVTINGTEIPLKWWRNVIPNKGATVRIQVVPAGGNFGEILKVATVIAVTVAVSVVAGPLGPWAAAGLTALASIGTTLLLNSVFPPPGAGGLPGLTNDSAVRKSLSVVTSQSNRADPYGPRIKPYGRNRVYPRVASAPYSFFNGNESYLVTIYDFGIGDYELDEESLRIGETSLSEYEGVTYNIVKNFEGQDFLLYVDDVFSEAVSVSYNSDGDSAVRTTQSSTDFFQVDVVFPQGLAGIDSAGNYVTNSVYFTLEYRENGTSEWKSYKETEFEVDPSLSSGFYIDENKPIAEMMGENENPFPDGNNYQILFSSGPYTDAFNFTYFEGRVRVQFRSSTVKRVLNLGSQVIFRGQTYLVVSTDGTNSFLDRPIEIDEEIFYFWLVDYFQDPLEYRFQVTARNIFDDIVVSSNSIERFFTTISVFPKEGAKTWDVRLVRTRVTENGRPGNNFNDFQWTQLKSYKKESPINTNVPHTFLELKIRASDQLNGQVDTLSAETTSILDVYDTDSQSWVKKPTNNPAWIFADILTGELNQRRANKNRLDVDSLVRWANYCDNNLISYKNALFGFEANFVIDSKINTREILRDICSTGRASLNYLNGKYGVIIDEERTTPVQVFSPRNYSNFKSSRKYVESPHALKCKYVDPKSNWQINEVIVYDDGQDETTATLFEEMDLFGVTNEAQAWRQGRYYMAMAKLRQEDISIRVSIDHLACTRGDLVKLVSDTMKAGGVASRIKSVVNDVVILDDDIFDNGGSYSLMVRQFDGQVTTYPVSELVATNQVRLSGMGAINPGELAIFGEVEKVAIDCIVKSIIPDENLNATLILTEYAKEIFAADTGTIPEYSPVIVEPDQTIGAKPGKITNLNSEYVIECDLTEKRYRYTVLLTWEPPSGSLVENFEVYSTVNGQRSLAGIVQGNQFRFSVENRNINIEHEFRVLAVSGTGAKLSLGEVDKLSFTPYQDNIAPGDINKFDANILSERIELEWEPVNDCDIEKYVIKFFPDTTGARWSISQVISEVSYSTNSKSVPLKNGTYLIKAVDWAGNYSETEKRVITTIPEELNIKLEKEVFGPTWNGTAEGVTILGNGENASLILSGTSDYSEFNSNVGYFYFNEILDLGDVFKTRFESQIIAGGFGKNSLMKNWETLADVENLAGGDFEGNVKAELEIRVQANGDFMADWQSLADVRFLAFGSEATSGPWKKLTVGDFTGRKFQFRLKLETNDLSMSPIVQSAKIKAFFPSRDLEGADQNSGTEVVFNPGFVETPKIQITAQQNLQPGDYHRIIEKNGEGFTVQFYDEGGNPVNDRSFDWKVTGFGVKYFDNDLIYS